MEWQLLLLTAVLGAALLALISRLFTRNKRPLRAGSSSPSSSASSSGVIRDVSSLPGPKGWPILGNLVEVTTRGYHVCHLDWMHTYGTLYKYRMGPITVVVVADPALVREMTTLQFRVFHDRPVPPTAAPSTDKGLLFATGDYWAGLRASLTPHFHNQQQVSLLYPYIQHCCSSLITKLEKRVPQRQIQSAVAAKSEGLPGSEGVPDSGVVVDILPLLEEAALDAIGMSCFGAQQWNQVEDEAVESGPSAVSASAMYSELERLSNNLGAATQLILLLCPDFFRPLLRRLLGCIPGLSFGQSQMMRAALFKEWQGRLAARSEIPISQGTSAKPMAPQQEDLVNALLRARVKGTKVALTNEDITAALFNLIGAGSGTTAGTIACALHFLALDQDAQRRAFDEIRAVLGEDHRSSTEEHLRLRGEPNLEALSRMPFLDAVIKEALRLCPPGALVARKPLENAVLGSLWLPKGTPVLAPVYAMHRFADFFPRPDEFLPERFVSQVTASKAAPSKESGSDQGTSGTQGLWSPLSESAYFPFGLGPRMCLGQKYAMIECRLFLAMVLLRFSVRLVPRQHDLELMAGLNLKPRNGVKLVFCHRG